MVFANATMMHSNSPGAMLAWCPRNIARGLNNAAPFLVLKAEMRGRLVGIPVYRQGLMKQAAGPIANARL